MRYLIAALVTVAISLPMIAPVHSLSFETCTRSIAAASMSRRVECGTFSVPLDYSDANGVNIELFVVRLPSSNARPKLDPLLMISGGPGQASSESFLFADKQFQSIHRSRDIYLLDQRGTGRSSPLVCSAFSGQNLNIQADIGNSLALAQRCLQELSLPPEFFTTSVAVQDIEQLRVRLGIQYWNIYGVSYGTRVAQHYLRRYPESTRSLILDSVLYPELNLGPEIAVLSQAALDSLIHRCEQDSDCDKAYPELREGLETLISSLDEEPVDIEYENFVSGKLQAAQFGLEQLMVVLRMSLYSDEQAALLPSMLAEAYLNKNFAPLARSADVIQGQLFGMINLAMHSTVVCAEDYPFYAIDEEQKQKLSESYMGTALIDTMTELCEVWPQGPVDDDFKISLVSDKPVLLISGSEDPITPASYAEKAKEGLDNASHIVLRGQGHAVAAIGCMPTLMSQFLEQGSSQGLDASCINRIQPAAFFLDFNGPKP